MADNDTRARLEAKRRYFSDLDKLTESDDDPDPGQDSSREAMRKAIDRREELSSANLDKCKGLPRSMSDTNLPAKDPPRQLTEQATLKRPSIVDRDTPATLRKGATFAGLPSVAPVNTAATMSAKPKTTGKRKRGDNVKLVPEAQQVFRGLQFYFFPNDDKHPARRMRIHKALEFGATWLKDWDDSVTHVIADRSMDFDLFMKFLKRQNNVDIMPPSVTVVCESYPAECISYRAILDPKQRQFQLKGYNPPTEPAKAIGHAKPPDPTTTVSGSSDISLKLKPAGQAVMARQPETPTTDEPASSQRVASSPKVNQHIEIIPQTAEPPPRRVEPAESTAEFDVIIQQARELQHVPLDADDEHTPTSSGGPATDDGEELRSELQLIKKRKTKYQAIQDKFQCMQKHTGENTSSPNATTIGILQSMADYYGQMGDEWRTRAYRKAISTLRNHPAKVWTKEEALKLPQIGERLAAKIEEIAFTNRLRRLDNARAEPSDQILQTFMQVYGAGFAQASKWIGQGYTTLNELLEKADLTDNQRIGIEHYEDFNSRIPRAEVERHGDLVRQALQEIDPAFEVIVGGSYRRGSETSGDVDCIVTHPDTGSAHIRAVVLDQLVPKLITTGFLVAALATTSKDDGTKWHGASKLPDSPTWRRIDLLLVPSDEMGAALIYFTGNDIFNRSLRLLASTKGMRLNQRGLYRDVTRGKGREKLSEGALVEGKDEKRIFEVLGVPWRPPEHRIC